MRRLPDRPRLARALRVSWRLLKLTVAPPRTRAPAPEAPAPSQSAETPANAGPSGSAAHNGGGRGEGVLPTVTVPASCDPLGVPNGPEPALSSGPLSNDALEILNARMDLFAQRLDLLRDEMALQRPRGRRGAGTSVLREVRTLRDRLDQVERRTVRQEELASRAALRPPRVPTGLEMPEPLAANSGATEWDFVDTTAMGPRLNGSFQDLRLATLLELLQLERRIGILVLRTGEHTLELDLRRGAVVGVRLDGVVSDVVAAVREAFRWPSAEFAFRRTETPMESGAPQSIHGLLLEVLRQNDEDARSA